MGELLIGLLVVLLVAGGAICGLIAMGRTSALEQDLRKMRQQLQRLETRLAAREQADLLTGQLIGIAGTIDLFVMMQAHVQRRRLRHSALLLTLTGLTLMVPNPIAIAGLLIAIAGIQLQVREVEEPYLRRVHGHTYRDYTTRVGRFLPWLGRTRDETNDAARHYT